LGGTMMEQLAGLFDEEEKRDTRAARDTKRGAKPSGKRAA